MKTLKREYKTFYEKLAYKHAPINYQYVNESYPRRDMICKIDYDGDWDTSNNRNNISTYDLIPVCYYSVAETSTHYYILYTFYHADDLTHENDLEGCLLILNKDEEVLGMISIAHWNFYSYSNKLRANEESIDGKLYFEDKHVMIKQEADKHGLYAWRGAPWYFFWLKRDSKDALGICYYPSTTAVMPDEHNIKSFKETRYSYILIDITSSEGFWNKRFNKDTFRSWGVFNASTNSSANAPWVWDDFDDKLLAGTIFFDPATIAWKYFKGFSTFDNKYIKRMDMEL